MERQLRRVVKCTVPVVREPRPSLNVTAGLSAHGVRMTPRKRPFSGSFWVFGYGFDYSTAVRLVPSYLALDPVERRCFVDLFAQTSFVCPMFPIDT